MKDVVDELTLRALAVAGLVSIAVPALFRAARVSLREYYRLKQLWRELREEAGASGLPTRGRGR
jgi:hypothetical protein